MRVLRHGYTIDGRTDGSTVVKRYLGPAAERRRETERPARCRQLVDMVRTGEDAAARVRVWRRRAEVTRSWTE